MEMNEKLLPLADALERVMREAGALACGAFGTRIRTWVKEHNSPVSEIDIAVDRLLKKRLAELAPEAAWLSEESEDDPARLGAWRVWIVDPIHAVRRATHFGLATMRDLWQNTLMKYIFIAARRKTTMTLPSPFSVIRIITIVKEHCRPAGVPSPVSFRIRARGERFRRFYLKRTSLDADRECRTNSALRKSQSEWTKI